MIWSLLLLAIGCKPTDKEEPPLPDFDLPDWEAPLAAHRQTVRPIDLDPAADILPANAHLLLVPDAPTRDELFLFFAGSGGRPVNNELILHTAAVAGYRSLGLAYPNDENTLVCDDAGGFPEIEACLEGFRREKLEGTDETDAIDVNRANSIEGRLITALRGISRQDSDFEQYLVNGEIQWSKIVVGGFSQGSAHAAFIAREHLVARIVTFSSGADFIIDPSEPLGGRPAAWCVLGETPASRWFGLLHERDSYAIKQAAYAQYELGQFGDFVSVDEEQVPYSYTHQLSTDLQPEGGGTEFHKSLANDALIPVGPDGLPRVKDAHYYMMTAPI